jgi:MFS family permease
MAVQAGKTKLPVNKAESPVGLEQSAATQASPRVFYGWWIVAACVAMLTLSSGIGFYGLGVFLPLLEQEFNASPALASLGGTVFFLVLGLASPFVGRWVDSRGARLVMIMGSALFGAGLIGLALSQELWQTYTAYAAMAVGFGGTALIPVSALVSAWFSARRGLAMAVAMSGISLGGVVMTPLATQLIVAYGWRAAALTLAVLVWVVGVPLSALIIRRRPEDLGLLPDGVIHETLAARTASSQNAAVPDASHPWNLSSARRTRAFWGITVGYLLINLSLIGVLMHQIRFLTSGTAAQGAMSPQAAAFAVSLTALASIVGRLALGAVIDRLSKRWVTVGLMVAQAAATVGLLVAQGNLVLVYLAVLTFGLGMGCAIMLQSLLVSDMFGVVSFGEIYGATMFAATAGMAAGPWLSGYLYERFGSYEVAFITFAGIALLAAISISLARPPTAPFEASMKEGGLQ